MIQELLYEQKGTVVVLTLNRPEKRNALTGDLLGELIQALENAKEDSATKVVLLTGNGPTFSAGADFADAMSKDDMKEFPYPLSYHLRYWEKNAHRLARVVRDFNKPYICALNGAATGWGMDLASMCDLRIVSDQARAAMTYVNIGLAPGGGGCFYLPKIIGLPRALELIWTGRWINAQEMLSMGYAMRVVPSDRLLEETLNFAQELASGPSLAQWFSKKLIYSSYELNLDQHLEMTALSKLINWTTEDVKEGIKAFLQKRKPEFKGK